MKKQFSKQICSTLVILLLCDVASAKSEAPTQSTLKFDGTVIEQGINQLVDSGAMAGAAVLVQHANEEAGFYTSGFANIESKQAWQRDTLAALYSMTKPITGVVALSLYEEGLFKLEDPLSMYLPEFTDMNVIVGVNDDGAAIVEKARQPIRVVDLFRHTACFGYGWEQHPASQFMNEAQIFDPTKTLAQFSKDLAKVPLYCHPGEQWKYGVSTDILARLAEVVANKPFEQLVFERVLDPLKMTDTRYFTRKSDLPRLATVYRLDTEGNLNPIGAEDSFTYAHRTESPIQVNGGHGLVSSIDDYMRFALMLQNEGMYHGVRILKPETVALMTQDHLPDDLTDMDFLPEKGEMGFGLTVAVRKLAPQSAQEPYGAVGEFFWDGAASTMFWVDPKNDITVVFLTQVTPFDSQAQAKMRSLVYTAFGLKN